MKLKFLILILLLTGSLLFIKLHDSKEYSEFSFESIRSGDIIFTRGISIKSFLVLVFQRQTRNYSHCGIIKVEGNQYYIFHATPTPIDKGIPRVVKEPIREFLTYNEVTVASIYRVVGINDLNFLDFVNAQYFKKTPFDQDFNLTNDKLYCTELIWQALKQDNFEILDMSKISKIIFPSDLLIGDDLKHIYTFKRY